MDTSSYLSGLGRHVAVLGSQWGDEGKGKLVDILAGSYPVICRATGGANAGHTIVVEGEKHVFHLMPSGILYPKNVCFIGNGCVIHLQTLIGEIDRLKETGVDVSNRFFISPLAHIVFDFHKEIDGWQESSKGDAKVGTTKRGIGPAYADKINRMGMRFADMYGDEFKSKLEILDARNQKNYDIHIDINEVCAEYSTLADQLKPFVKDMREELWSSDENILFEGANGCLLDIDHGTFPFVTSSSPTTGGLATGVGVPATYFTDVIGIIKAYCTRVGAGPFPTEINDELGEKIREQGNEYGSTTGRPRRCGWFDAVALKFAVGINGHTELNLTKLDVLSGVSPLKIAVGYGRDWPSTVADWESVEPEYIEMDGFDEDITAVRSYDELPENARAYIEKLEELAGVPIKTIGVGPGRDAMIYR